MAKRVSVVLALIVVICTFLLISNGPARGQDPRLESETVLEEFQKTYIRKFSDLVYGNRQPGEDEHKEMPDKKLIPLAAKYYVYSNSLRSRQQEPGLLHRLRHSGIREHGFKQYVIKYLKDSSYVSKNRAFRDLFVPELILRMEKVFALPFDQQVNRVAIVNTGLMMPILAELQRPDAADYFAKLLEKKDSPLTVKLFACQALKVHFTDNAPNILPFEKKGRQQYAKQIDPLIAFLFSTPKDLTKMSTEEVDAYRYIRCEAIKALAQTKLAWVPELPPPTKTRPPKVHAPVAYALLRVLAGGKDGLTPQVSLEEKLEAVKGLCQIDAERKLVEGQKPYYNPELAVPLIGQTLLSFADAYRQDYVVFKGVGAKDKKKENLPALMAWKHAGEELRNSLAALKKNVTFNSKAHVQINSIANKSEIIFDQTKRLQSVDDPFELRTYVKKLPPPKPEVYRGFDYKIMVAN